MKADSSDAAREWPGPGLFRRRGAGLRIRPFLGEDIRRGGGALIVQELLQAGGHDDGEAYAFLHTDGSFRRETALVGAARLGRLPVVRALLKAAPGNASSSAALDAAFRIAVAGGHRGVARELLDANRSLLYESAKSWAWQVQGAEDMLGGFRVEDKARLVLIAAHKHKHLQGIPAHLIQRIVAQIFMKRE